MNDEEYVNKYNKHDIVIFLYNDEELTGEIVVVDRYFYAKNSVEIQYDIICKDENICYKHIPESKIIKFKGESEDEEKPEM